MRVYIIDFYSEKTLKEMNGSNVIVPQVNDEVYVRGCRYNTMSRLFDYDSMRVQVYVTER